ncbi:glycosyltransferase family A protein [Ferrimonas sp. SCSIO 43195]|uniref:glycosyltransferase family 2 protein n=1 Tax=Ferrimonas sp. SCSIO 43195 TaxID=2822844 RepID=UPI002074D2EC|nr:glycosyltransferase family A protein [Ferrimonas sp. SCSIO 43195]USD35718.1 glycosyltransferase family 2 protein [Ferrimonas sp. SCSIO 43195]
MEPSICVIIPSYNCLEYLPQALDSIWAQSLRVKEVWVVDDGSSDGTAEWLQQQRPRHPALHSLRLENVGPSAARNAALQLCQSDWVAFLDADDLWYPDKLARQWAALSANPDATFCISNYLHIDEQRRPIIDCFSYWPEYGRQSWHSLSGDQLFAENVVGTSTVLARTQALRQCGGFDETLRSASDWDLWLKLIRTGECVVEPECQMDYLMRAGSITRARLKRLQAVERIIDRHQAHHSDDAVDSARAGLARNYAEYYQEQGMYAKACAYQWQALRLKFHYQGVRHLLAALKGGILAVAKPARWAQ